MLPLATLPCKGQGSTLFFLMATYDFLVQLDSLCFSEFKNIAHPVYLNLILISNSIGISRTLFVTGYELLMKTFL
jgi:hypothetical protein